MGYGIATLEAKWILPAIGFFLGMSVVLAEPAVYVLTEQVEEVTSGHIKRKVILMTLSVGIACCCPVHVKNYDTRFEIMALSITRLWIRNVAQLFCPSDFCRYRI